ncbi:MAG: hypothetical protein DDT34_02515 [Firmicutes bacterium]|nr:hypothetical protein [Bacillota bacterium]
MPNDIVGVDGDISRATTDVDKTHTCFQFIRRQTGIATSQRLQHQHVEMQACLVNASCNVACASTLRCNDVEIALQAYTTHADGVSGKLTIYKILLRQHVDDVGTRGNANAVHIIAQSFHFLGCDLMILVVQGDNPLLLHGVNVVTCDTDMHHLNVHVGLPLCVGNCLPNGDSRLVNVLNEATADTIAFGAANAQDIHPAIFVILAYHRTNFSGANIQADNNSFIHVGGVIRWVHGLRSAIS